MGWISQIEFRSRWCALMKSMAILPEVCSRGLPTLIVFLWTQVFSWFGRPDSEYDAWKLVVNAS